ncbi:MAG: 2Fe-2S iron-sulfur cluster-binding protein [Chloroflexota bacterium]
MLVMLDGAQVEGTPGMTILELARRCGVPIPTLCYHPDLSLSGSCRLCVVEVQGSRTLVGSCHTPISANMVIQTQSPRVLKSRRLSVQLLLASHSGYCWSCDKANLCELRQVAADLGIGPLPITLRKPFHTLEALGPHVVRDATKCILCRRCVRACRERNGSGLLAVAYRGFTCKIVAGQDDPNGYAGCADCVECVSVCPVGALTKSADRFARKHGTALVVVG